MYFDDAPHICGRKLHNYRAPIYPANQSQVLLKIFFSKHRRSGCKNVEAFRDTVQNTTEEMSGRDLP